MLNKLNRYLVLTQRIAAIESNRNNCEHEFNEFEYNPFVSSSKQVTPRWKRQCLKCGKNEYKFEESKSMKLRRL